MSKCHASHLNCKRSPQPTKAPELLSIISFLTLRVAAELEVICVCSRLVFSQSLLSLDLIEEFLALKTEEAAQQNTNDLVLNSCISFSSRRTDVCYVGMENAS